MTRGSMAAAFVVAEALAAVAPPSGGPRGQAGVPQPTSAAIKAERIHEKLYVLRGGGRIFQIGGVDLPQAGTTVAFITSNGVVLVDTKLPGWGQPIIDKLKEITDKPVTMIINTHTHVDHVGGNVEFPAGVEVVAHEKTAALMREMRPVSGGPAQPKLFDASGGRGLPTRTFADRMTIGGGADRIDLYYFGRAHTSGDAWVVFPALRVVHAGDAFGGKVVPLLDANNGASGVEYPATLARAAAALTDVDTIINGHSPTALTMADLRVYADFVREFVSSVQAAKRSGQTIDDFVRGWKMPDRYVKEGYVSMEQLRSIRADVEVIWNETRP